MDLTAQQIKTYQQDGVLKLDQLIDDHWVERLLAVAQQQLDKPGKWANDGAPGQTRDRMFTDRYLWRENAVIREFIFDSACAQIAAQAMHSQSARFYFDHLLVKEPETESATPWHQDIPYWPFLGKQVCSIWVALTPATVAGSAMEFVRGSHLNDTYYKAEVFGKREDHPNANWTGKSQAEPVPDIEANRSAFDIVGWDVKPGDAILFSSWLLHGAPGNASSNQRRVALSTRWLGDDAIWHPHEGADPTVGKDDVCVEPGLYPADDDVFPLVWQKSSA